MNFNHVFVLIAIEELHDLQIFNIFFVGVIEDEGSLVLLDLVLFLEKKEIMDHDDNLCPYFSSLNKITCILTCELTIGVYGYILS